MNHFLKLTALSILMILGFSFEPAMAQAKQDLVVIDVRTPAEYGQSHLTQAQNIDFYSANFPAQINGLDKNKTYKLYCRSGNRAGQAERMMKNMGFKNVENLGSLQNASKVLGMNCGGPC